MIIERPRVDPFETKIDSTEIDAEHRDLAQRGYRHYANVTDDEDSVFEAMEKAGDAGYSLVHAHGRAYDDKGVVIAGAVSVWVKR